MTQYDPNRPNRPRIDPDADLARDRSQRSAHPEEPVVMTGAEARQAREGRPVLYVLIAGLVLALAAWALVEMYPRGGSTTADAPATTEQASPGPQTTGSTPGAASGAIPGQAQQPGSPPDVGGIPIAPDSATQGVRTAPPTGNTPPTFDSAR